MDASDPLSRAKTAFDGRAWREAYRLLSAADSGGALQPEDLERLAIAAYLVGEDPESTEAWARAHQAFRNRGRVARAARCAFWLAFGLLDRGESARAGGWVARARRLLDEEGRDDCVEEGYLLLPEALSALSRGEGATAHEIFVRIVEIARRFRDPDLSAMGRLGRGQSLLHRGRETEGIALLDEAMAAVDAGGLSPIVVGIVYCAVVESCWRIFDLERAREWTEALSAWCDDQPDLVPFRGQCLVRRAQILQLRGRWAEALEEAGRARERLTRGTGRPAAGAACYQEAEVHRLQGDFAKAESAYGRASRWGRTPQPGLAELRLAEGRLDDADHAIGRVLRETQDRWMRFRILPVHVDVKLRRSELEAARGSSAELTELANETRAPFPTAMALHARAAVLLAEGDAPASIEASREASTLWERLDAPYHAARSRVLVGLACHEVGDEDTARMELKAARWAFQELGADPDRARVASLAPAATPREAHGLTPRQLEVLRLVAGGETNRKIADRLFISERTVERHVSDILQRLGVSSRTAATAYAYEHQLV